MQIRAKIERINTPRSKTVRLTFAKDVRPFVRETIIQRNIGARPWAEGSSVNSDGQAVRTYSKTGFYL